jgi:hypothetical protein
MDNLWINSVHYCSTPLSENPLNDLNLFFFFFVFFLLFQTRDDYYSFDTVEDISRKTVYTLKKQPGTKKEKEQSLLREGLV